MDLDLSNNEIESLPNNIKKLSNLLILKVDNNKLKKLPELPKSIYYLSSDINNFSH